MKSLDAITRDLQPKLRGTLPEIAKRLRVENLKTAIALGLLTTPEDQQRAADELLKAQRCEAGLCFENCCLADPQYPASLSSADPRPWQTAD